MGEDILSKWTFGLINSARKYLTAETFQSKVNCNGTTLKKKQLWIMEKLGVEEFGLKSSTKKYLTSDKNGKLNCSGEEIGPDQKFIFETHDDGRVAIKSATHGRYIGGSGDNMTGFDQSVGPMNLFTIHLAIHPQVNIRNVNRKTFMHLSKDNSELCCNEVIPWGYDATITLQFHEGKYAIQAANSQYLNQTGSLMANMTKDCLFTIVFKGSQIAFQDCNGNYLTAIGAKATVASRKSTIGRDELFELMDSQPQVRLVAANGKYVSVREGLEVRAKQTQATDKEIFQMEPFNITDSSNIKWIFRTCMEKVWNSGATIIADQEDTSLEATHFSIEWMGPIIAIKASNGKYISIKPNGQMVARSAEITENCKFIFEFINRPNLVLRGEYGFVGVKGSSGTLECNRSQYSVFRVVSNAGTYQIKDANEKYFKIESDNSLSVNGDSPTDFFFEIHAASCMAIIAPNGKYLKGQQNGRFTATGDSIGPNTLWEY